MGESFEDIHRGKVTASIAGRVFKAKSHKAKENLRKFIMSGHTMPYRIPACLFGIKNEPKALYIYEHHYLRLLPGWNTYRRLPTKTYWITDLIGATPDATFVSTGSEKPLKKLVEIKTIFQRPGHNLTLDQIIGTRKNFYVGKRENGSLFLKQSHNYYAQVQLQLLSMKARDLDFVIYNQSEQKIYVINVCYDEIYTTQMLDAINNYINAYLR